MNKLEKKYEEVCNEYVDLFCKKQEMDFEGWVANSVGGIALCNDFFFNFHDIVWDINTDQPEGLIVSWYYDNTDNVEKSINYFSYTKGLRIKDI
jgi:hypothetical protein